MGTSFALALTMTNANWGSPGALLRLALPLGVGSLLNLASILVDRLWVGRAGSEALAGLGLAHAVWMILLTVALGMGMGTLASVAHAVGAGDRDAAGRAAVHGLGIGALLGGAALLAALLLPTGALGALTPNPEVAAPATTYLRITMAGMLLQAPLLAAIFSLHGVGAGRAALQVGAIFPLLNVVLDPLLIFSAGLGLPGAAVATVLANTAALTVALTVLARHLPLRRGWSREVARRIVRVGAPGSLEHLVRNLAGFGLVALLLPFGAAVVSGYTAGLAVLMVLIFPGLAIGQATASLVGRALGGGDRAAAAHAAWNGVLLYGGLLALAAPLVHLRAEAWIACFDASPAAVRAGAEFLRTLAPALPLLGVGLVLSKAFSGARQAWPALASAALAHLGLQLPLVFGLSLSHGAAGAFLGMALAFCAHGILTAGLFARRFGMPRVREVTA